MDLEIETQMPSFNYGQFISLSCYNQLCSHPIPSLSTNIPHCPFCNLTPNTSQNSYHTLKMKAFYLTSLAPAAIAGLLPPPGLLPPGIECQFYKGLPTDGSPYSIINMLYLPQIPDYCKKDAAEHYTSSPRCTLV